MKFGVDFGTTRTTVALVDRGNYPLISFISPDGDAFDHVPSVVALDDTGLLFGFEAHEAALKGGEHIRSFKRLLSDPDVTPRTTLRLGNRDFLIIDVLTRFLKYVAGMVRENSSAVIDGDEPLEAVIGIPAHAWSAQRFMTLEAFKAAGWHVIEMMNEPSAAGFEYTHRHASSLNAKRTRILVYDLGGGTFDASLVEAVGRDHAVLDSAGDNLLGGDDFDMVLAQVALRNANVMPASLSDMGWQALIEECRVVKESLNPNSRNVVVTVGDTPISFSVKDYYEAATPLVEHTLEVLDSLLSPTENGGERVIPEDVAGLYVVGGASEFPLVSKVLRRRFGRRVHRSIHNAGSTAIGLAIAADEQAGYTVSERLARGLGVFREYDSGASLSFDPLLTPDDRWTPGEDTLVVRRYMAAHNVGYYRFVEYRSVDEQGVPRGQVSPAGEIIMPFDPALQGEDVDLKHVSIERTDIGHLIEERYRVDENGIVDVEIADTETGYTQSARLG